MTGRIENSPDEDNGGTAIPAFSNPLLAVVRTLAILAASIIAFIMWASARLVYRAQGREIEAGTRWTRGWIRVLSAILGLRVNVTGAPPTGVLLAPNHAGYMDVLAVGCATPCHFVAKADVKAWPLVGAMFNISGQIGIVRKRSKGLLNTSAEIAERLRQGDTLCVFLEGTSSGGDHVMPFYSSLVQPAIEAGAAIVPVGIRWYSDNPRIQIGEDVAYWKDHVFAKHVWRITGLRGIRVDVNFGEPISAVGRERKALANELREKVVELSGLPARDSRD